MIFRYLDNSSKLQDALTSGDSSYSEDLCLLDYLLKDSSILEDSTSLANSKNLDNTTKLEDQNNSQQIAPKLIISRIGNDSYQVKEKFPYTCMTCPSKFQQFQKPKNIFFLQHQETKPVDSITEDIGNININKSRPNSDTDYKLLLLIFVYFRYEKKNHN